MVLGLLLKGTCYISGIFHVCIKSVLGDRSYFLSYIKATSAFAPQWLQHCSNRFPGSFSSCFVTWSAWIIRRQPLAVVESCHCCSLQSCCGTLTEVAWRSVGSPEGESTGVCCERGAAVLCWLLKVPFGWQQVFPSVCRLQVAGCEGCLKTEGFDGIPVWIWSCSYCRNKRNMRKLSSWNWKSSKGRMKVLYWASVLKVCCCTSGQQRVCHKRKAEAAPSPSIPSTF